MINRFSSYILLLFIIAGTFSSCTCKRKKETPQIKISITRFENDLFTSNLDSLTSEIPKLKSKYGEFFDIYNYKVIQLGASDDSKYAENLKRFVSDYYMNLNYKEVKKVYPNLNDISNQLSNAFSIFKSYFPKRKVPHVYSCISGWNQSIVTSDTILAIALDKYLGRNCDFYERLQLDKYMTYTMQREYIVPDCMRTWGYTEFELKDSAINILSNMLYEAKIVYFVKQMLPEEKDSVIFGFSPNQLKWCENNKKQMWTFLVEHKILFSNDNLLAHKLVFPAPFTSLFTKESPGRACVFLGYEIIKSYMNSNKNISLPELMADVDYNKILRESKFKP